MLTPITDITLDTSLTASDLDIRDLQLHLVSRNTSMINNHGNRGTTEYSRCGNKSIPVMQQLCQDTGVVFEDDNTRK